MRTKQVGVLDSGDFRVKNYPYLRANRFIASFREAVDNQAQVLSLVLPPPRAEGRIVGEGAEAVPALIDALRNEAQVL